MNASSMRLFAILSGVAAVLICALPHTPVSAEAVIAPSLTPYERIDDAQALRKRVRDRIFHVQDLASNKLIDVYFSEYDVEWREADAPPRIYRLSYMQSAKSAKRSWALLNLMEKDAESWRHFSFATVKQGSFAGDYLYEVQTKEIFRILAEEKVAPKVKATQP